MAVARIDLSIAHRFVGIRPDRQQRINVLEKLTNASARIKQRSRVL